MTIRVRAAGNQEPDGFGVIFGCRPHQSRFALQGFAGVGVGVGLQQRRIVSGSPVRAAAIRAVSPRGKGNGGAGARLEEQTNDGRAAIRRGQPQGRDSVAIGGVRVRAGLQQHRHNVLTIR